MMWRTVPGKTAKFVLQDLNNPVTNVARNFISRTQIANLRYGDQSRLRCSTNLTAISVRNEKQIRINDSSNAVLRLISKPT